jgi:hypothetical protein
VKSTSFQLDFFLQNNSSLEFEPQLEKFCQLDDYDVLSTLKNWIFHPDKVLSTLSAGLVQRKLLKVKFQSEPFNFVFTGEAINTTYDPYEEKINILFKDGSVKDISQVDHALIQQTLARPMKKYYICFLG